MIENPCIACGACCATFRVSFYWTEADPAQGGSVPQEMTEDLPPFRRCMRGTNQQPPRCIALGGTIGEAVLCSIYEQRPTPCREFGVHWNDQQISFEAGDLERCNRARIAWGLPPITLR